MFTNDYNSTLILKYVMVVVTHLASHDVGENSSVKSRETTSGSGDPC